MIQQLSNKHIIQKQNIEIDFEDISDGLSLQNRIADLFYEKLLPQMELLFDEFANDEYLISFETLTLDCGVLSHQHWEEEWIAEAVRSLRKELLAAHKIKKENASKADKSLDDFLYFLQTGRLPWNSTVVSINELAQIERDSVFLKKLIALIQEEQKAADRLVYHFSEAFVKNIITLLIEEKKGSIAADLDWKNMKLDQKNVQSGLIKMLCKVNNKTQELVAEDARNVSINDNTRERKKNVIEPECIYVHNAGLILLHPFLEELFSTLDLRTEQHWNNDLSAHTAAIVLEYLISGSEEYAEFNLPLNKILCGLTIEEVVIATAPLSQEMKEECDNILQVVIQYWSVLKNTGIDTLRETFLQRHGKLTEVENGWLLQVEQKTVDVLLGQLPWGISVVKLPWMNRMLFTEWA